MGNLCFKGSEIDRKFSYANLNKEFQKNIEMEEKRQKADREKQAKQAEQSQKQAERKPWTPTVGGIKLDLNQWQTLNDGGYIFLENMVLSDKKDKFSSYVFLDDEKKKAIFSFNNPDEFVKYGQYEMRIRDKIQVENGFITKAKVKWWGGIDYQYPYLWKEKPSDPEYKLSWGDPRKAKEEKSEKTPELRKNLTNDVKKNRGRKM